MEKGKEKERTSKGIKIIKKKIRDTEKNNVNLLRKEERRLGARNDRKGENKQQSVMELCERYSRENKEKG